MVGLPVDDAAFAAALGAYSVHLPWSLLTAGSLDDYSPRPESFCVHRELPGRYTKDGRSRSGWGIYQLPGKGFIPSKGGRDHRLGVRRFFTWLLLFVQNLQWPDGPSPLPPPTGYRGG